MKRVLSTLGLSALLSLVFIIIAINLVCGNGGCDSDFGFGQTFF